MVRRNSSAQLKKLAVCYVDISQRCLLSLSPITMVCFVTQYVSSEQTFVPFLDSIESHKKVVVLMFFALKKLTKLILLSS